jgi:hypothetical protein
MFETVSVDATAYLMSAWRGEVNLLELAKPEYMPFTRRAAARGGAQFGAARRRRRPGDRGPRPDRGRKAG